MEGEYNVYFTNELDDAFGWVVKPGILYEGLSKGWARSIVKHLRKEAWKNGHWFMTYWFDTPEQMNEEMSMCNQYGCVYYE